MKAAGLLDELLSLLEKRNSFCGLYDAEMDKFKTSRDNSGFANALKKLAADYASANSKVISHQNALAKEDPDSAEKVEFCCHRFTPREL